MRAEPCGSVDVGLAFPDTLFVFRSAENFIAGAPVDGKFHEVPGERNLQMFGNVPFVFAHLCAAVCLITGRHGNAVAERGECGAQGDGVALFKVIGAVEIVAELPECFVRESEISDEVLAGYLAKISDEILHIFPNHIINIHPSLLPKYGGKGMYGLKVHQAVLDAKDKESGITIHYINSEYDKGEVIVQEKCEVLDSDTAESLAERVHKLEYKYFPETIEKLLS